MIAHHHDIFLIKDTHAWHKPSFLIVGFFKIWNLNYTQCDRSRGGRRWLLQGLQEGVWKGERIQWLALNGINGKQILGKGSWESKHLVNNIAGLGEKHRQAVSHGADKKHRILGEVCCRKEIIPNILCRTIARGCVPKVKICISLLQATIPYREEKRCVQRQSLKKTRRMCPRCCIRTRPKRVLLWESLWDGE